MRSFLHDNGRRRWIEPDKQRGPGWWRVYDDNRNVAPAQPGACLGIVNWSNPGRPTFLDPDGEPLVENSPRMVDLSIGMQLASEAGLLT